MYGRNAVVSSTERERKELMEMMVTVSVEDDEMSLKSRRQLARKSRDGTRVVGSCGYPKT